MKKLVLLSFLLPYLVWAQAPLKIETRNPVSPSWKAMLGPDEVIRDDKYLNEEILDLVECYVRDSVLERVAERHRVFPGPVIRWVGLRWKAIQMEKTKWVGTSCTEIRIPDKPLFTEYDVNFNLVPHLPKYREMLWRGIETQLGYPRVKKEERDRPPYVPMTDETLEQYHLHCECTPLADSLVVINEKFYPCIRPSNLASHPNFGEKETSVGLYGSFISDCNHSCHPEIHPYEWIWWLDLNPQTEKPAHSRTWVVGMMRDVSNRMKHWTPDPRTGVISVPFAFSSTAKTWKIQLERLVSNEMDPEDFKQLVLPEGTFDLNFTQKELTVDDPALPGRKFVITTHGAQSSEALRAWIDHLNYDPSAQVVTGFFNLALSVKDVYTTKVRFVSSEK
ncbi:MAG: hypothetical protein H6581_24440 [Bacteroidia bacterium]|nr:hypothetical protein [Bacteroidia bacterium]